MINTSVSRISDASMCLRYWWLTAVQKLPTPENKYQAFGSATAKELELVMTGQKSGTEHPAATVILAQHYPLPGQQSVQVECKSRAEWAGATLWGYADLIALPGTSWPKSPENYVPVILDVKTIGRIQYAKATDELRVNRQLLSYVRGLLPDEPLVTVGHVTVERTAPYTSVKTTVSITPSDVLECEDMDRAIIAQMSTHKHAQIDGDVPAANSRTCSNWYGQKCHFYDRCHKSESAPVTKLSDLTASFALVGVERGTHQMQGVIDMVNPPDAAKIDADLLEGKFRIKQSTSSKMRVIFYAGERHGSIWELRLTDANGGAGKFLLGGKFYEGASSSLVEGGALNLEHVPFSKTEQMFSLPAGFWPSSGFPDIETLRAQVLYPILQAWDVSVAPKDVKKGLPAGIDAADDDGALAALSAAVESVGEDREATQLSAAFEIQKLASAGCSENQAQTMFAAGYTLDRMMSGSVSLVDLTALKGFGETRAKKVYGIFETLRKGTMPDSTLPQESAPEPTTSPDALQLTAALNERAELEKDRAKLEQQLAVLEKELAEAYSSRASIIKENTSLREEMTKLDEALQEVRGSLDPNGGYVLHVGCISLTGPHVLLEGMLEPYMLRAAQAVDLEHFHLLKRFDQQSALVKQLQLDPPSAEHPILISDPTSSLWSDVRVWFCQRAFDILQRL